MTWFDHRDIIMLQKENKEILKRIDELEKTCFNILKLLQQEKVMENEEEYVFKVGDKVKVLTDSFYTIDDDAGPRLGDIILVCEECKSNKELGYWIDETTVDVKEINNWQWTGDFELADVDSPITNTQKKEPKDVGKHYRYSFRLNLTEQDKENGYVMVNIDPYRVSQVYNLGGWREHLVKKGIRGTEKGHSEEELIEELQCTLNRAKQMLEESRE